MNVLEKILEEINNNAKLGNMRWESIRIEKVEEIIRSHMDEVTNMSGKRLIDANALDDEVMNFFLAITGNPKQTTVVRECKESFRRVIDEQPRIYADDGWIPVSERLPEEGKEVLAQFVVRVRNMNNQVYEKTVYIYPLHYEKGTLKSFAVVPNGKVVAWQPLPEPYKGGTR